MGSLYAISAIPSACQCECMYIEQDVKFRGIQFENTYNRQEQNAAMSHLIQNIL